MNTIDRFYISLPKGRCNPCQYARHVFAQDGFAFLGCYKEPYHGKLVSEIMDCPLKETKESE